MTVTTRWRNRQSRYAGCVTANVVDPVDLVVGFLNSIDVEEGTDAFASRDGFRAWTRAQPGLTARRISDRDWRAAVRLRDALRESVSGEDVTDPPAVPLELRLESDGYAALAADDPTGTIAAAVARLAISGDWERVKICPADDCRWAFYDASRNRSRQWCSMAVCGNRAKARAHRERAR